MSAKMKNMFFHRRFFHLLQSCMKESTEKPKQPWTPMKRLSRSQMDHLRMLYRDYPQEWTVDKLQVRFGISFSAVKRILRSKFEPSEEVKQRQDQKVMKQREKRREQFITKFKSK
uniref:Uncharacterized protein n=1 Tax=Amphimedon queenslandica TaxID=400682 RepID=A0A1X7VVE1_AMPQE